MVAITAAYVLIAARTLGAIRRQGQTAIESAEAAKRAANEAETASRRTKLLERPWITLKLLKCEGTKKLGSMKLDRKVFDADPVCVLALRFAWQNTGRSVARLTSVHLSFGCGPLATRPAEPTYKTNPAFVERLIAPGERTNPEWAMYTLSGTTLSDVLDGAQHIVVFGRVIYTETVDDEEHETRFSFIGHLSDIDFQFRAGGPPAYTRYT